ncbi:MAG: lipase family protein [Clostridia bacterium]|nr:lipase family protein [Clostridia bacterium]
MKLYNLMLRCVNIPYSATDHTANFSTERDGDTLFIFFQDSADADDWQINLDFPAKAYKRMGQTVWRAHRGFLEAWKRTEPLLAEVIMDKSVKKMILTGYSHGAAIALLCHEYVWFNRPELRSSLEGYGFGCPKVLWGKKNTDIDQRWERFTVIRNIDDIVTHLPPSFLGYRHVGKMLVIGKEGKYSSLDAHRSENILTELRAYCESMDNTAALGNN